MEADDAFGDLRYDDDDEDFGAGRMAEEPEEDFDDFPRLVIQEDDENQEELENLPNTKQHGKKDKKKSKKKRTATQPVKKPAEDKPREAKRRPEVFTNANTNNLSQERMESIFSSVSPLDWHLHVGEEEFTTKRRRIDAENAVSQATLRILAARMARNQPNAKSGVHPNNSQNAARTNPTNWQQENLENERQKLLMLPPMDGYAWYGITSPDGGLRRYLAVRKKQFHANKSNPADENSPNEFDAYYELLERIGEEKRRRMLKEMETAAMEQPMDLGHEVPVRKPMLWTDKYSPRTFLDLLTDDETNRLVLLWLRLWDGYVFRRKSPNFWDTLDNKDRTLMEIEHRKGGLVLPKQNILVLHGPSGVGKSSLAQMAAKQAGYRPLVLAISEFQNIAELRNRLENATNSTAIQTLFQQFSNLNVGQQHAKSPGTNRPAHDKPVCFILEGLELANAEMIHFICDWSRRTGPGIVRRPMVCTCASIWQSPVLKELRTNALALRVQHCSRERLQQRLNEICTLEGIQMDRAELLDLIQSHGQDIRLCLNTLQFVTANSKNSVKASKEIPSNPAESQQPVNTSKSVSMLDMLAAIFTLDFHEDNRGIVRPPAQRARKLLELLGQLPQEDFARLQQLIFANFASVLKLSNCQRRQIAELFVAMDHFHSLIQQSQHFALGRYLPFVVLNVHFVCAVHVSRRLQFSMIAQPFNERMRESQQVIRSVRANASSGQIYVGTNDLHWLLPHLHCVLQPPIKLANFHLQNGPEKRQLERIVHLMHIFRIQYVLKYGAEGGGSTLVEAHFCFEPPFDLLTRFPLPDGRRHFTLPEPIKKFIAHQVELAALKGPSKTRHGREESEENNDENAAMDVDEEGQQRSATQTFPIPQIVSPKSTQHFNAPFLKASLTTPKTGANSSSSAAGPSAPGQQFPFRFTVGSSPAAAFKRRLLERNEAQSK